MKVLLTAINAKYIHSNLAVYNLRAYAQEGGMKDNIEIAEYTINNRMDDILEGIYKAKPDVLCFSCYIWNIAYIEELICEYHKLCPDIPVWVGGPEVSYEVEDFLTRHRAVAGVMIGEGEQTFLELCGYYGYRSGEQKDGPKRLNDVRGIAYRSGEEILFTGQQEPLVMGRIPFCYRNADDFKNRIIYYESSRGCPFRCSYCLSSVEKQLRFRDLELVKKELSFFLEQGVPQVKFVDRTFNCNHNHAMEIWRFIKEHDNGITNFHFEISADLLLEEELELIGQMRPGLIQLEIGVQSANEATIKEIHRTMRLDLLKDVVKKIQQAGNIHEHLDLIAGLPFEDYKTFQKSFDEIYALKPNQLQLGFLKVLKGSYMYEHAAEYGMLYHDKPPYEVMRTKWLLYDEVLLIKQAEEMLEVYYNSGQFEVTVKVLETLFKSAFIMYQSLGAFYEEKGYFGMSHSRIRRSEILLEFAESMDYEERSVFLNDAGQKVSAFREHVISVIKESLIFDLYYRENCKSRPFWADNTAEWKELSRQWCRNRRQAHVERFHYRFPDKEERTILTIPKRLEHAEYILFDYTNRDPLNHQAMLCRCN